MKPPMIVDYVTELVTQSVAGHQGLTHLDVGAGWGDLIGRLRQRIPGLVSEGCDYNPQHNQTQGIAIKHVNLNQDTLPYPAESFALVTCTEVLEHVENFRHVLRQIHRVLKPQGRVVISTPNVLNFRSRFYFFLRGFFEYFDPYPLGTDPTYYPGERHITPIPYFYLAHALLDIGFDQVQFQQDKPQKLSRCLYPLLAPLCLLATQASLRRRRRKLKLVPDDIERIADDQNHRLLLTGRTLIVTALKKDPGVR